MIDLPGNISQMDRFTSLLPVNKITTVRSMQPFNNDCFSVKFIILPIFNKVSSCLTHLSNTQYFVITNHIYTNKCNNRLISGCVQGICVWYIVCKIYLIYVCMCCVFRGESGVNTVSHSLLTVSHSLLRVPFS